MDRQQALEVVRETATEVLEVDAEQVVDAASFRDDLEADSLDVVEFVMGLEERLDISIPEEELEGVETVGQAVDLIVAKVGTSA